MHEPSYVREARLAQQRYERRIPVQLEIGGLMETKFNTIFTFDTYSDALDFLLKMEKEGYIGIILDSNGNEVDE